jgi:FixJ family two-component response regulator
MGPSSGENTRLPPLVMVADDDASVRDCTARLLRNEGYACHTAATADEVCDLLTRYDFDLIIADIVMPGNARLELLGELAALESMPPLLLITGHPSIETATKAVDAHVAGYLTKPVDAGTLLKIVRREIDVSQSRRFIRRRREHLEGVMRDLRQLEKAVASERTEIPETTLNTYTALLAEHVLCAINDLRAVVSIASARQESDDARRQLARSRPVLLLEALRDTVAVLEKTKRSFKSKELADLRHKLEALLAAPHAPETTSTARLATS